MLIKYQALTVHLNQSLAPLYILTGTDTYLLEHAAQLIKKAYKKKADYEEKKISIQTPADWHICVEEANSYALFSENTLIDAYYEKKSLDAIGKSVLNEYLKSVNPRCLIIIRASELPAKQVQVFTNHPQVTIVVANPLDTGAMRAWIIKALQHNKLEYTHEVPELIQQLTEGNMLACAQAIEKIALTTGPNSKLSPESVITHLNNQSHYQIFDLTTACLLADATKAITILRHAFETREEPTLVLWVLSNEIRLLLQLHHKISQGIKLHDACSQLKIWSNRVGLYQKMIGKIPLNVLQQLIKNCHQLDEKIKTTQSMQIWQDFESIAIILCLGPKTCKR